MKKVFSIAGIFGFALLIHSCDYVSNVIETGSGGGGNTTDTSYVDTVTVAARKVLIEDYTGHKCGNCPAAAKELHRIDSVYHEKIVPLAIHAGGFANTNGTYPTDFKTTVGTTWDQTFGISANGNPNGLVNRKNHGTSNFILGWTAWETTASPMTQELSKFNIKIFNTYNSSANTVTCKVGVKALKDTSGIFNLQVILVEDSIIAEQLDYNMPAGQQIIHDYLFMHVLRGTLNSEWGTEIFNGTVSNGSTITKTFSNYALGSNVVPKNCHIIAFVYNADPLSTMRYEVLQVEKAEIMP